MHGDKAQEDRHAAIHAFKQGTKDVLVATDVASKVREACVLASWSCALRDIPLLAWVSSDFTKA